MCRVWVGIWTHEKGPTTAKTMETRTHGASEKGKDAAKVGWSQNAEALHLCVFTQHLWLAQFFLSNNDSRAQNIKDRNF